MTEKQRKTRWHRLGATWVLALALAPALALPFLPTAATAGITTGLVRRK